MTDHIFIRQAWAVPSLPTKWVAELTDNQLVMFDAAPMCKITEKDLQPYRGAHPQKGNSRAMLDCYYRFYGLQKNDRKVDVTDSVAIAEQI